jgi:hypothetical protein
METMCKELSPPDISILLDVPHITGVMAESRSVHLSNIYQKCFRLSKLAWGKDVEGSGCGISWDTISEFIRRAEKKHEHIIISQYRVEI